MLTEEEKVSTRAITAPAITRQAGMFIMVIMFIVFIIIIIFKMSIMSIMSMMSIFLTSGIEEYLPVAQSDIQAVRLSGGRGLWPVQHAGLVDFM